MNELAEYVKQFLTFIFTYLIKQKQEESKKVRKALKDEIECNFVDSDDDETYGDEDENEQSGQMKGNSIVDL